MSRKSVESLNPVLKIILIRYQLDSPYREELVFQLILE